ncbi:hypothetical protein ACQ86D_38485 [Streptomyces galilaeus]
MDLRVLSKADAVGAARRPMTRRRELPDSLERLDGIGLSAAPLDVTGTDGMFDEAETWLRREGFLPPAPTAPRPTGIGARLKQAVRDHEPEHQIRLHAQLNNLRRLREARSRTGLRAATDAMVDGGHALHFEVPNSTDTGVRRVRLLLTATRDIHAAQHAQPGPAGDPGHGSGPDWRAPTPSSAVSRTAAAVGPMASISGPTATGGGPSGSGATTSTATRSPTATPWAVRPGTTSSTSAPARTATTFGVPVRLALDLYADDGDRPSERFGRNVNQALAPAPAVAAAPAAPGAPPVAPRRPSSIRRRSSARCGWRYRTAVPRQPSVIPAPPAARADGAPRRETAVDRARLDGTDDQRCPAPGTGADTGRRPDRHRARCRGHRVGLPAGRLRHPQPGTADAPAATGTGTGPILPVTAPAATGTAPAPAQPARRRHLAARRARSDGQHDTRRRDPARRDHAGQPGRPWARTVQELLCGRGI